MIELLRTLIETVTTVITFLMNTINSLIQLVMNIPKYSVVVINSLNILPSYVIPFAIAFISLVTVQYILNRR